LSVVLVVISVWFKRLLWVYWLLLGYVLSVLLLFTPMLLLNDPGTGEVWQTYWSSPVAGIGWAAIAMAVAVKLLDQARGVRIKPAKAFKPTPPGRLMQIIMAASVVVFLVLVAMVVFAVVSK